MKLRILIPFILSIQTHLVFSQNFVWDNSSTLSDELLDVSNWKGVSTGFPPNDFTTLGYVFDLVGSNALIQTSGTVGNVRFYSSVSGASISIDPNSSPIATLTIQTDSAYLLANNLFDLTNMTIDFSVGTVEYTSSSRQTVIPTTYKNIKFSNGQKTIGSSTTTTINGLLTEISGSEIYLKGNITFGSSMTMSVQSSTRFIVATSSSSSYIVDNRTGANRIFSGIWRFVSKGPYIGSGTYEKMEIFNDISAPVAANATTITITNDLNLSHYIAAAGSSPADTFYFAQGDGSTLTILGTITNNSGQMGVRFTDINNGSTIIFSGNYDYNLYIGHPPKVNNGNKFKSIIFNNNISSKTLTLYNSITISNELTLGINKLAIQNNRLTFTNTTAARNQNPTISVTTGAIDASNNRSHIWLVNNVNSNGFTFPSNSIVSGSIGQLSIQFTKGGTTNLNQNTTILGNIDFYNLNSSTSNMPNDDILNINGYLLKINGAPRYSNTGTTPTSTPSSNAYRVKFRGSTTSSLYCLNSTTLYFDQTSASTNTLKDFKVQGSNATVTLANALNITSNGGSVEVIAANCTLNTGNNLTLKSDANGTARIANSPGTISGNYYAEQYFPANREFRFMCAPVVGATALQWRNNASTSSHTGLGISITGANPSTNSFDASTANKPSAFWYDETIAGSVTNVNSTGTDDPGWTSIANGNSYGLTNGKGFRVLVRGDRNISLILSPPTPNTTTITSYGSYPRTSGSSVVLSVTNTNRTSETNNGLNLIGNPFPSTIDWDAISLSNVDNGYATYDPVGRKYKAWNGSLGDATQYISSGQAFFVMCTSSGTGTLTIEESDKFDGKGGNFFLEKLTNHMRINLMYDSVYNSDAFLHFRSDAKNVKDEWDIQQYYVNGTNIGTLDSNGKIYKINSLAAIDSFESIPLSVAKTPEAQLKLSFYDVVSFEGYKIELVDTYLKSTMPVTEGSIYTFDITADSNSVKDGRFYLNFKRVASAGNKILQASKIATIHPNPVTDNLNIALTKEGQPTQFEIFNVTGQLIASGATDNKSTSVNTKDYASGTYYIVLKTNNSSQTIQFVK